MATGDELLGHRLGEYLIEARIGAGATGVVFRGRTPRRTEPVALKVLHDTLGSISGLQGRFEREARVLAKLHHPHIVEIYDYGVEGRFTFIAMEMLVGETLEEHLAAHAMPPDRVLEIYDPVLEALAAAHELDIVHRDLKPANVFLTDDGDVKLLDFGLSKILSLGDEEQDENLTRKGRIVGTPAYMAPEQITGAFLDVRADVYAMGVMLYELLADRRPFLHERRKELLRAHLLEPVMPIMQARPGLWVCDALQALLERAMVKDPLDRFPNAGAMLAALRALPAPAVSLDAAAAQRADRRRTGASSAILSAEERAAVTESATADTRQPTPPRVDLEPMAAPRRDEPSGTRPVAPPAAEPGGWTGPIDAAGSAAAPGPRPSNLALFALALTMLGVAAVLWIAVMTPGF
jgi:serine/threonine protein kinase